MLNEETKKIGRIDRFFGISEKGSTIRTEIIAGIVIFLSMAYILTVNPNSISSITERPKEWASVFIATALGATIGTLLMAFLAKMPLVQAPGLGLNTMAGGLIGGYGAFCCTFGNAMLMVLISGILFLLLSIITIKGVSLRELVFDGIPDSIKTAISVGTGLFISFVGLQNAGLIVNNDYTLVELVDFSCWNPDVVGGPIICVVGLIIIAILEHFKVKGSVIIGIICATALGIPLGVTTWNPGNFTWEFWEHFANFFSFEGNDGGTFLAAFSTGFDWSDAFSTGGCTVVGIILTIITFSMLDMFDTMGTVVGISTTIGFVDENGKPLRYNKIMMSDSIATCAGALLGTSTVTTFIESGSGIAAGGRTGLTALTSALLFLLSIFLLPLISSIPLQASACALVYVGALLLKNIKILKFDGVKDLLASFVTMISMPLTYSITTGIGLGILVYMIIDLIIFIIDLIKSLIKKTDKPKWDMNVAFLIVSALFIIYFFIPITI